MKANYYYEVYKVDKKTGKRAELIAKGYTKDFGDKIITRTKREQRKMIECTHGFGNSIYMKQV